MRGLWSGVGKTVLFCRTPPAPVASYATPLAVAIVPLWDGPSVHARELQSQPQHRQQRLHNRDRQPAPQPCVAVRQNRSNSACITGIGNVHHIRVLQYATTHNTVNSACITRIGSPLLSWDEFRRTIAHASPCRPYGTTTSIWNVVEALLSHPVIQAARWIVYKTSDTKYGSV